MVVNTLISAADASRLSDAVFVDCRFDLGDTEAGEAAFRQQHIPGARYAHLDRDLSGTVIPDVTGRHPLPELDDFAQTLGNLGIQTGQPVVAYDGGSGAFAARLWWLLRHVGHDQVWVLDGGYQAWIEAGLPTSVEQSALSPTTFSPGEPLNLIVSAEDIAFMFNHQLFDARDEARYRGEVEPIDPVAGHIPGAVCLPFVNNLAADGKFKSPETLREQFTVLGVDNENPVVCYCGSGVTACHNILALVHAGYPQPILYPGSWSEWITDPDRPIATQS